MPAHRHKSKHLHQAEAHFQAGMDAYRSGRLDRAISEFSAAIGLDPELLPARYQRAMALARCGDNTAALEDFAVVVEVSSDRRLVGDAHYNIALARERMGDLAEAALQYRSAAEFEHIAGKALCNRGSVLNRLDRFEEAITDLSRAIELDPSDALAYWNRAIASNALGSGEAAVLEDVRQFLRLAPADHPLRRRAEKLLEQAAGRRPATLERQTRKEAQRLLGRVIQMNNDERYEDALAACDRLLELDDTSEVAWDEKAFALLALGRWADALSACEKGLARIPHAVRLHRTRASILERLGRNREALAEYRAYVETAPPEYGQVVAGARARIRHLESAQERESAPER